MCYVWSVAYLRGYCLWLNQRGQTTVCDFMNGRAIFFSPTVSSRVEFHFIEKNKGGNGWGEGRGGGVAGVGW